MSSVDPRRTTDLKTTAPVGRGTADRIAAMGVVVAGPDEGREVAVEGELEIGSESDCGLALSDPAISRRHLLALLRHGFARDLTAGVSAA